MANDLNTVVLCGNLVRDCELKYTQGGVAVGNISIAVNRSKKQGEQWISEVSYFDVVLFGKTAENLKQYLSKGKKVAVQGFLKQDRWQDQNGQSRSRVSIIAENLQLLGGNENHQQNYQNQQFAPQKPQNNAPQYYSQPQQNVQPFAEDLPFTETDIPF